jgi:hypothetical protein
MGGANRDARVTRAVHEGRKMKFICRFLMGAALLFVLKGNSAAAPAVTDPPDVVACMMSAVSTDKDPKGLNVRAGPGTDYPVIGRIPPPKDFPSQVPKDFPAHVQITGSKDGWFRINRASQQHYDETWTTVFEGKGWVSGRLLGILGLYELRLHSEPSMSAPVVAEFFHNGPNGEWGGPDSIKVDRLNDCRGFWVESEGTQFGVHFRGWGTWIKPSK